MNRRPTSPDPAHRYPGVHVMVPEPPVHQPATQHVLVWFVIPDVGGEYPLMALTEDPDHGQTYRPLLFVNAEAANHPDVLALVEQAAASLGNRIELLEFELRAVLDRVTP